MASSKRERELARRRVERQTARRAEAEARRRRRRRLLLRGTAVALALAVAVTVVVTKVDFSSDEPAAAKGDCTYNPAGEAAKPIDGLPPTTGVSKTSPKTATLATNRGPITLSLLPDKAPCTVNSFAFLAKQKYFDGTSCHRVTTGPLSVLQCGDPAGTGQGGPGYQFAEENLTGATYKRGTVAMARTQEPGSNGSQFFLVYADSQLDPDYTPFGTITEGLDLLAAVGKAGPVDGAVDPKPKLPVTLTSVTVA